MGEHNGGGETLLLDTVQGLCPVCVWGTLGGVGSQVTFECFTRRVCSCLRQFTVNFKTVYYLGLGSGYVISTY
jgi:hypothetical protein